MSSNSARADDDALGGRTVTVSASAEISAEPDFAIISAGAMSEAPTAREALDANSAVMRRLIDGLIEMGVKRKDIKTSGLNVHPRYDRPKHGGAATVRGYSVSNTVSITARDLTNLGEILDQLVTLGANQIHGLSFQVSNADVLKDEARTKAIANARRRAALFATAAGAEVGKVLHISENVTHQPGPRVARMGRAAMAESVPIEPGSQSLRAQVTVTWALRDD